MGDRDNEVVVQLPPRLATLPHFRPDIEWLTLSTQLISIATPDQNTHCFLTLYRALPTDLQKDYKHLLLSREENTYDALQTELTNRFTIPDHAKFNALYNLESIGDRSPLQFLRDLRRKFSEATETNPEHLRYAFAMGMPPEYRNVILSQDATNLDETSKVANDMWQINSNSRVNLPPINSANFNSQSQTNRASVTPSGDNSKLCDLILDLSAQMKSMSSRIHQLESSQSVRSASTYNNKQKQNTYYAQPRPTNNLNKGCPPTPSDSNRQNLCYFHACFGRRARKCNAPCTWPNFKIPPHRCDQRQCPWDLYNLN